MIVRCRSNKVEDFKDIPYIQKHLSKNIHQEEVWLEIDRQYVVYGIVFWDGTPWYYVCEEDSDAYPKPHFHCFFEIVEPHLSSEWEMYWPLDERSQPGLLPHEWAQNPGFYERLLDGNQYEKEKFQSLKSLLDAEAEWRWRGGR